MNYARTPLRGPTRAGERALAPDLARGVMLLLIAVANTPFYLWGREHGTTGYHPTDGSALDRIVQVVIITGVDMRVYPMFAFLFGYGMVQILNRQQAAGVADKDARALLRRRNWWLLAFGAAHALLLWMGDVMGAYGVAGLLLAWLFIRRADRTVLVWAGIGVALLTAMTALSVFGAVMAVSADVPASGMESGSPDFLNASVSEENVLTAALMRIAVWPMLVFGQGLLGMTTPVAILLAFWAARRRVLEEPWNHLRLLRTTAIGGIALGWATGLPHALHHIGVMELPASASWVYSVTQLTTGLACGLGYVALFGLIGARMRGRTPGVVGASVVALGKRSMSGYVAQSVLCAPILTAWGLGLGAVLGSATMALYAVGIWLVTVAAAAAMERMGKRGPLEVALRRLAYRRTTAETGLPGAARAQRSSAGPDTGGGGPGVPGVPGSTGRPGSGPV